MAREHPLKTLCVCMARDRNTGWRDPGGKRCCCNINVSAKTKGAAKPKQIVSLNDISFWKGRRLIKTELKVSL